MTSRGHCSPDELLDVAEGTRAEADVPHLSECAGCRTELSELKAALTMVPTPAVPEPSPLFWEHFPQRVGAALAEEPARAGWVGWVSWPRWWVAAPVAAVVALGALFVVRGGPTPSRVPASTMVAEAPPGSPGDAIDTDETLTWMGELAASLDRDAIEEAGLAAPAGTTDRAVADLSSDERLELERLLKQALAGPDA